MKNSHKNNGIHQNSYLKCVWQKFSIESVANGSLLSDIYLFLLNIIVLTHIMCVAEL